MRIRTQISNGAALRTAAFDGGERNDYWRD
jgi:hypothetical protein